MKLTGLDYLTHQPFVVNHGDPLSPEEQARFEEATAHGFLDRRGFDEQRQLQKAWSHYCEVHRIPRIVITDAGKESTVTIDTELTKDSALIHEFCAPGKERWTRKQLSFKLHRIFNTLASHGNASTPQCGAWEFEMAPIDAKLFALLCWKAIMVAAKKAKPKSPKTQQPTIPISPPTPRVKCPICGLLMPDSLLQGHAQLHDADDEKSE